jgi:putative zinc finger/helix-turn-helix YgiT family protein
MRCLECGGGTKARRSYKYHYTESGLSNFFLNGITVHTCAKCGAEFPELPAVQNLHAAIGKAVLAQREALRGEEVRFLRKEMGIKAKDFAEMLGVTKVAVSRWENSKKPLNSIADRLIRCVFLLHRLKEKEETPDEIRTFLEAFQSGLADITKLARAKPTEIDVRRELAAAA